MTYNGIKVSVIIPVYNVEKYVRDSVRSIMNQSLKDIEIIIVNDGSSDKSFEIISELAEEDGRIQIISNPNQGLSIARNIGLYRAVGKYVYFFDSDDFLEENALEICYKKCNSEHLDFAFFDAEAFYDDNEHGTNGTKYCYRRADKYDDRVYSGIDILDMQLKTNGYQGSACLSFINRKYLSDIQLYFYPKLLHEDELFTFLLYIKASKVGVINAVLFHRRLRKNSIVSTQFSMKNVMGYITVCRELQNFACEYNISKSVQFLVSKRIQDILLSVLINSREKLQREEFIEVKRIVYFYFVRYITWKMRLRVDYPSLFQLLYHIKLLCTK